MKDLKKKVYEKMKKMDDYRPEDFIFEKERNAEFYKKHIVIVKDADVDVALIYEGIEYFQTSEIEIKCMFLGSDMIESIGNVLLENCKGVR